MAKTFGPPRNFYEKMASESERGREQVEQGDSGVHERAVHLLAPRLGGVDARLEPAHPSHGRLPLLLLLAARVLERHGPPPPEQVGHEPHRAAGGARGGVGRRGPRGRRGAGRRLGGRGGHAAEDRGRGGGHGGRGGREGVGEGGLVGVVVGRRAVGEVPRGGRQAGHLPRRPPLRPQRGGEAGAVAPAQRRVRLAEELRQRHQRLAEAPVEVGQQEQVVQQLLRPGVPPQRVAGLRVVEQVRQPRQHAPRAPGAVRHPRGPRLRRRVRPRQQRARRLVQRRRQRVQPHGEAGRPHPRVRQLLGPRAVQQERRSHRLGRRQRGQRPTEPHGHCCTASACSALPRKRRPLGLDAVVVDWWWWEVEARGVL
jgi:hypothetical protein